jgi:hypothetical protein
VDLIILVVFCIVIFFLVKAFIWLANISENVNNRGYNEMVAQAGIDPNSPLVFRLGETGIALNPDKKSVTLYNSRAVKTYPYSDIRSWEIVHQQAQQILNGGVAYTLGASLRAQSDAKMASGLFVTVRDIENPVWRIAILDQPLQLKWMEILRQEINEGGVDLPGDSRAS